MTKLSRLRGQLNLIENKENIGDLFEKLTDENISKSKVKLEKQIAKLETEIAEKADGKFFEENNAFEWRFEFPEVLDEDGNDKGFDVVIGNPPYIRHEEIKYLKPHLSSQFETFAGTADIYIYFVEQGLKLMQFGGEFSFILPNKWMRAGYGEKMREWVKDYDIQSIIDFGDLPVFEEATTYPCIWEISKSKSSTAEFYATEVDSLNFENSLKQYVLDHRISVAKEYLNSSGWNLVDRKVQLLIEKLKQKGTPLGEYVNGKIFRGTVTGLNEAFVIDEETRHRLISNDPKSEEIIKPLLRGKDIKKFFKPMPKQYLILATKNFDIETYNSIFKHLSKYEKKLKKKAGSSKWFELQASPSDIEKFESIKIMYPDISKESNFIIDRDSNYCLNTIYNIESNSYSLLAYLNSKVFMFFYKSISNQIRGGYFRFFTDYVKLVPIPNLIDNLNSLANVLYNSNLSHNIDEIKSLMNEIDQLVYKLYDLTEEEIAIVEGS